MQHKESEVQHSLSSLRTDSPMATTRKHMYTRAARDEFGASSTRRMFSRMSLRFFSGMLLPKVLILTVPLGSTCSFFLVKRVVSARDIEVHLLDLDPATDGALLLLLTGGAASADGCCVGIDCCLAPEPSGSRWLTVL